jgi:hypothetical protein
MPPLRRSFAGLAIGVGMTALTQLAVAQGLPPYLAVNPIITSRSGVHFQPYVEAGRPWQVRLQLDYGSAIEFSQRPDASFLLDAELLRLDATVIRNLGAGFVGATVGFNGSYGGFLDGFLDWYHNLIGLQVAARGLRPRNEFAYSLKLPNGDSLARPAKSAFLGDVRLIGGRRFGRHWQGVLALTFPTAPEGYGRQTVSASALAAGRYRLDHRWTTEMGLGLGVTPTAGALSAYQQTAFAGANLGFRYRFIKQQAMFVNLLWQSRNYQGTGMKAMDDRELTLDYGFLLKAKKGPEWFLGMTEDLEPRGPAIDLSFRIGARW